jgi:hypothetical protein
MNWILHRRAGVPGFQRVICPFVGCFAEIIRVLMRRSEKHRYSITSSARAISIV